MLKNYTAPNVAVTELWTEGTIMLTQSDYDEKHNTERLEWDDAIDL